MRQIQYRLTRNAHVTAVLFAVVLALAATSQAIDSQTSDSTASAPQTNGQRDLPESNQGEVAPLDQSARPGAIGSSQMLEAGDAQGDSKPAPETGDNPISKPTHSKKHKHNDDNDNDEFRCTPDTPTTSAACGYR